jgi:hypothetical protein
MKRPQVATPEPRRGGGLALLLVWLAAASAAATPLSDPQVDAYKVRVGTQTFSGLYQFTTNSLLVETAQAIQGLGCDTIKLYLGPNYPRQYKENLPGNVTSLLSLAKDGPSTRPVLDMPFRHIIAWAYPFSNPDAPFANGSYTPTEQANDYREMYDLTRYLLTNYNNSGKTFYLGHWEGDGYLDVVVNGVHWATNPSPAVVASMIAWENNRQKAVDDAKAGTACTNVNVFYYAEVNRVRDARSNGPTNNIRAINAVVPYVTNLDFVSYSSYDAMNYDTSTLYAVLDYVEANIPPVPAAKAGRLPAERLWIGEYGWGGSSPAAQEPLNRAYVQRLLNYGAKAIPFILYWEIYDNETNTDGSFKNFCLIDSSNSKVPSYYLHQRFINSARLAVAQFKETNGRLPTDSEFIGRVSPLLDQPLPAPVALTVANLAAIVVSNTAAQVSGCLAQGNYGDEQGTVRVFWGQQDGGTVRTAWEHSLTVGVNTHFNPATFTASLPDLANNASYCFRFYATNSGGEAWAPASGRFDMPALNPAGFGSCLKLTFAGYNRAEPLTNFPALVCLGAHLPGFSYRQFASPTGGDLRFTDSDGKQLLPAEIETWNTNGTSSVWVRLPRLSGPSDCLWAYWGNPVATNPPASQTDGSVWAPGFELVWHLRETNFPYADSTLKHPATSGSAPTAAPGRIGQGCAFNGTANYLNAGTVDLGDQFTLSAWVNLDPSAFNIQTVWANQKTGYGSAGFSMFVDYWNTANKDLRLGTGNGSGTETGGREVATPTNAVSFGQWHLLSLAIDRTNGSPYGKVDFYVDGAGLGSASVVSNFTTQAGLNLGRFTNGSYYFRGTLDEARIENRARSSNWVWATWLTVASNTALAAYSAVTQAPPTLALAQTGNGLLLAWPGTGVGFGLYAATNLAPPVSWLLATNQPALVSTQWQVQLPRDGNDARFFRLQPLN